MARKKCVGQVYPGGGVAKERRSRSLKDIVFVELSGLLYFFYVYVKMFLWFVRSFFDSVLIVKIHRISL